MYATMSDEVITHVAFRAPITLYAEFRSAVCRRRRTVQDVLNEAMRRVVEEEAQAQAKKQEVRS